MKHAIVTGGTKGIGLSIVKVLIQENYFVHLTYASDENAARKTSEELHSVGENFRLYKVDQNNAEAVHSFAASLAKIPVSCIVCNAGTTVRKSTSQLTDNEWNRVMQVNVNSHFFLIRDLWVQIQPNARIIFMGSQMAIHPHSMSLPYGVTKAALHSLAKNLVKDFEGTGTTVNVIAPGFVDTDWQKNKPQEIRDNICRKTAVHRFANTEEVADAVRFILHNDFINGATIEISGGYNYK